MLAEAKATQYVPSNPLSEQGSVHQNNWDGCHEAGVKEVLYMIAPRGVPDWTSTASHSDDGTAAQPRGVLD